MSAINKKIIYLLTFIFILLFLVVLSPYLLDLLPKKDEGQYDKKLHLSDFTKDNVTEFAIRKGEDVKRFQKIDNTWKLNEQTVSSPELDSFFESLTETEITSLASENSENHGNYELQADEAYILTFISGKKVSEFLIGKTGSSFGTFYIRKQDENEVYFAEGELRNKIVRSPDSWYEKETSGDDNESAD